MTALKLEEIEITKARKKAAYHEGYKYCAKCMLYYKVPENVIRCPSCGTMLRTKPRKSSFKERLRRK